MDVLGGGRVNCTSVPSLTAWATAARFVADETLFRRATRCMDGFVPREWCLLCIESLLKPKDDGDVSAGVWVPIGGIATVS